MDQLFNDLEDHWASEDGSGVRDMASVFRQTPDAPLVPLSSRVRDAAIRFKDERALPALGKPGRTQTEALLFVHIQQQRRLLYNSMMARAAPEMKTLATEMNEAADACVAAWEADMSADIDRRFLGAEKTGDWRAFYALCRNAVSEAKCAGVEVLAQKNANNVRHAMLMFNPNLRAKFLAAEAAMRLSAATPAPAPAPATSWVEKAHAAGVAPEAVMSLITGAGVL